MAMTFRVKTSGLIRAGAQRVSMRGREASRRQPGGAQQPASIRIALAGVGAAAGVATATAIVLASDDEGRLNGTLRPSLISRDAACWTLGLGTVVHADAATALKGDQAEVAELAEGDKPELIKQADAEAEQLEQLQRPAQFADQFHEVRNLTSVNSFEGFRLDVAKVVTPTFYASHAAFFGSPQFPTGYYQGALTVLGDGDKMIRATMDHDGNVSSEAHLPLGPNLQGKLNLQAGKQDMIMGTAVYQGDTFSSQGFLGSGPVFGVSYNQALTPRLAVGADGNFSAQNQSVTLQYGFKYNTPRWAFMGSVVGGNVVVAQYVRRVVPGRVTLGAEYQAQLWSPETSQTCIGAEFVLRQSKVSASLDSNGKVDSAMEVKLSTFLPILPVTFMLSSSLDHAENKATFGMGLTLGQ